MNKILIYHNPRWGKSRESVKILEDLNVEYEIVEYIKEQMGDNYPACLFVENDYDIVLYKNSIVWCAIECYAFEVCDEELMKERLSWYSY